MIINRAVLPFAAVLTALSWQALAQAPPEYPSAQNYQPQDNPRLSPQELSNLVAPIALYPDMLLSQVLAASTYPAEIVQAEQWMQRNPGLRGQQLVEAAKQQNWDPSVQALVAFPDVMNLLSRDNQWTTDLGNAFLGQQADVMDAIQQLRAQARDNGRLTNTPQQRVTYEQANGQNAIVIQPTNPQVVYVPVYNPAYIWGPPVYGAYPPLVYPSAGYGVTFAVGTFLGALFSGLLSFGGWGWGLSWLGHGLFLNTLFFSHFGFHSYGGSSFHGSYGYAARAAWVHDPGHRLGVPYGDRSVAARYGGGYGNRAWSGSQNHSYGYQGSSRQMEAYRALSASGSRGGEYRSGYSSRGFAPSSHYSEPRSFSRSSSPPHYSTPKSSGHSHGGEHSGGHGHSGGGGHSHGGHHKK